MNALARLQKALEAAGLPAAVSVSQSFDSGARTVKVVFAKELTGEQIATRNAVVAAFDWSDAAQAAWELQQQPEKSGLIGAATAAVAANATYLAISSPTQAQAIAQVAVLTNQVNRIIRRLIQL